MGIYVEPIYTPLELPAKQTSPDAAPDSDYVRLSGEYESTVPQPRSKPGVIAGLEKAILEGMGKSREVRAERPEVKVDWGSSGVPIEILKQFER
jgi:hypothetical protein